MIAQRTRRGGRPRALAALLGGLAVTLTGSAAAYALYAEGKPWPTSADGITRIQVCFVPSGELTAVKDAQQRTLVKDALAASWGRWLKIEFWDFGDCSNPPANATLAVELRREGRLDKNGNPICGGAGDIPWQVMHEHRGFQGYDEPTYGVLWLTEWLNPHPRRCNPPTFTERPPDLNDEYRNWAVVIHEFGHGLGYEHEQSRPDAGGFCPDGDTELPGSYVTKEYDDVGIMNYCGPGTHLSWLDIRGAQGMGSVASPYTYGINPAAGQWLNALPALAQLPLL
jgi:hypothetical protein